MALLNPSARFVLAHAVRKETCPSCGHKKTYRRYIDTITGDLLPAQIGVCDRENNCNYRFTAKEWIAMGGKPEDVPDRPVLPPPAPKDTSYRMPESDAAHFLDHGKNTLAEYLTPFFGREAVMDAFDRYGVGTYRGKVVKLHGATIFWQRDSLGAIRTGEIILYKDGHRSKEEGHHTWAHYMKKPVTASEQGVSECFFGEHLLANWRSWVGIVESAKTALICSIAYPDILWLSCRAMQGLTLEKFTALLGRDVILFPDAGKGFADWSERAGMIEPCLNKLIVSDILEAYGCVDGEDIADLIVPNNILALEGIQLTPVLPEEVEPEEAEEVVVSLHPPIIQGMINKNPAIQGLIDMLDLDTQNITVRRVVAVDK